MTKYLIVLLCLFVAVPGQVRAQSTNHSSSLRPSGAEAKLVLTKHQTEITQASDVRDAATTGFVIGGIVGVAVSVLYGPAIQEPFDIVMSGLLLGAVGAVLAVAVKLSA